MSIQLPYIYIESPSHSFIAYFLMCLQLFKLKHKSYTDLFCNLVINLWILIWTSYKMHCPLYLWTISISPVCWWPLDPISKSHLPIIMQTSISSWLLSIFKGISWSDLTFNTSNIKPILSFHIPFLDLLLHTLFHSYQHWFSLLYGNFLSHLSDCSSFLSNSPVHPLLPSKFCSCTPHPLATLNTFSILSKLLCL